MEEKTDKELYKEIAHILKKTNMDTLEVKKEFAIGDIN